MDGTLFSSVDHFEEELKLSSNYVGDHIRVESINYETRSLTIRLKDSSTINSSSSSSSIILQQTSSLLIIHLDQVPRFEFLYSKDKLDEHDGKETRSIKEKNKIIRDLEEIANERILRNKRWLIPCFRYLEQKLKTMTPTTTNNNNNNGNSLDHHHRHHHHHRLVHKEEQSMVVNENELDIGGKVPFPKTAGASFSGKYLIFFCSSSLISMSSLSSSIMMTSNNKNNNTTKKWISPRAFTPSDKNGSNSTTPSSTLTRRGRFNVVKIRSSTPGVAAVNDTIVEPSPPTPPTTTTTTTTSNNNNNNSNKTSSLYIYDISQLMPFKSSLAESYILKVPPKCNNLEEIISSIFEICLKNAEIARTHNRSDLVNIWKLGGRTAKFASSTSPKVWKIHPMGRPLLSSLINHCIYTLKDTQTASTLIILFQKLESTLLEIRAQKKGKRLLESFTINNNNNNNDVHSTNLSLFSFDLNTPKPTILNNKSKKEQLWFLKPGAISHKFFRSPYHTITTNFPVQPKKYLREKSSSPPFAMVIKDARSNSWSNDDNLIVVSADDAINTPELYCWKPKAPMNRSNSSSYQNFILDPNNSELYDSVKRKYGEDLLNLQFHYLRCTVLKTLSKKTMEVGGITTNNIGGGRGDDKIEESLSHFYCSLCQLPVKGLITICDICGHGGHTLHMLDWFTSNNQCCKFACYCQCTSQFTTC